MDAVKYKTHVVNAQNYVLGRLATKVALLLRGKNKATFKPNAEEGDNVVVYNLAQIRFSGDKLKQKKYYRHSGYLGNLKATSLEDALKKSPEKVLRMVVMGMLPKNKLRARMIKKLKVYDGPVSK